MDTLQVVRPTHEIVIRAEDRTPSFWVSIREVAAHHELLLTIVLRDIRVRYKQSVLGIAWAVIQPFTAMFIFTIIFSKFAKLPSEGVPYPLFSFSALLMWQFFSASVSGAMGSVAGNVGLIQKVYFPRIILPLAAILTQGVDFLIAVGVLALLFVYYHISPSIHVLYLLLLLLVQLGFMIGVACVFAAVNAYYRDVRYLTPMLMQVWLYATPVVWSMNVVPPVYRVPYVALNPMAAVIDGVRSALLHHAAPDALLLAVAGVSALLVLAAGYTYFGYVQRNFADII